ncbi:unnamed protein product [Brassica rapa subsp. trilocularis]
MGKNADDRLTPEQHRERCEALGFGCSNVFYDFDFLFI